MDVTRPQSTATGSQSARIALPSEARARRTDAPPAYGAPSGSPRKLSGYGLPCSKCHLYYSADLDACPTCNHKERVSPVVPTIPPKVAQTSAEPSPDAGVLEQEREEFLRQFKSQLFAAHAEVANAPASLCALEEHHSGEPEEAEVCRHCYDRLQERLDVCEAALHMDLKDAAQIVYDAVWADPSDPSKTYGNAANALLTELRKRSGIPSLLGPSQTRSH
jgi:hypothetical protein